MGRAFYDDLCACVERKPQTTLLFIHCASITLSPVRLNSFEQSTFAPGKQAIGKVQQGWGSSSTLRTVASQLSPLLPPQQRRSRGMVVGIDAPKEEGAEAVEPISTYYDFLPKKADVRSLAYHFTGEYRSGAHVRLDLIRSSGARQNNGVRRGEGGMASLSGLMHI